MRQVYSRFVLPLKSGTRWMLLLFAFIYIAQVIGEQTRTYDLARVLALYPNTIWSGQVWRLVTYAFITPTLALFAINLLYIGMLGHWLERVWSPREWWTYSLLCTLAAAFAKVAIAPTSSFGFISNLGLSFGLLAAWGRIFSHEAVLLMGVWKMSVRTAAIVFAVINFLLILPCGGLLNALVLLMGGVAGWFYLSLRWKMSRLQSSRAVDSVRMSNLEL